MALNKTFMYINHQNKGQLYAETLLKNGWTQVGECEEPALCLVDSDITPLRVKNLERIAGQGIKIFIYPHAARPNLFYDFPGYKPFQDTTAQLVVSEGHKRVLEIIGYDKPIHPVGWSYCPIRPFTPSTRIKTVLFAPIHANGNGWLSEEDRNINKRAFDKLLLSSKNYGFKLSVRFLGSLESCGLKQTSGIDYFHGIPDQSYLQIDRADVVVSHQTFAWISVARGKPTLMMDEDRPPRIGNSSETFDHVANWEKYKHLVKYPCDILGDEDAYCLMEQVCQPNAMVQEWRRNMIGSYFSEKRFLDAITCYFQEPSYA